MYDSPTLPPVRQYGVHIRQLYALHAEFLARHGVTIEEYASSPGIPSWKVVNSRVLIEPLYGNYAGYEGPEPYAQFFDNYPDALRDALGQVEINLKNP
jgi:hypothetical protein